MSLCVGHRGASLFYDANRDLMRNFNWFYNSTVADVGLQEFMIYGWNRRCCRNLPPSCMGVKQDKLLLAHKTNDRMGANIDPERKEGSFIYSWKGLILKYSIKSACPFKSCAFVIGFVLSITFIAK